MGKAGDRSAKFSKSCIIFSLLFNARCDFFFGCVNLIRLSINFRLRLKSSNSCTGAVNVHHIPSQGNNRCGDLLQYLAIWLYLSYR